MFRKSIKTLLWIGFGGLLLLMGGLGLSSISFLFQIDTRYGHIRHDFIARNRALEELQSEVYLSGTYVRDFLTTADQGVAQKEALAFMRTRQHIQEAEESYRKNLHAEELNSFRSLDSEIRSYLQAVSAVFNWTPVERQERGFAFIRDQVLPRRMALVSLAEHVAQLSEKRMEASSRETSELLSQFRMKLFFLVASTLGLGLLLAGVSLWQILQLEKESEMRFEEIARGKHELQELSAKVLAAHEEERRNIARELHDEVGQALWAVSLGLDNLGAALNRGDTHDALKHLAEVRNMSNHNVRMIRGISLLLRPSMLDDLGLVPALRWLAREVSRTSDVEVEIAAEDLPDTLPEDYKTCLYRVVQEALRNCSRHAHARYARVGVRIKDDRLLLSVQDDGVGFDPAREKGLGLLGMEERVTRIGGVLRVDSQIGRGTTISLELPFEPVTDQYESKPLRTA